MTTSENISTTKPKIQVQIHLNFQKTIAAVAIIFFMLVLPIYLNESIGWANIYKRVTQPPQSNPYSSEALAQREGTVQGISTSRGNDTSTSILENSNLNISKETMLILVVATLSVVVFFLMFFSLSYYEKKKAQQE